MNELEKALTSEEQIKEREERIKERIAGRKAAEEVLELVNTPPCTIEFYNSFLDFLTPNKVEKEIKEIPIVRLGQTLMPFGVYKYKTLDDVPLPYLEWLCFEQEEFYKQLRAYLKHSQLQGHRGEQEVL